MNEMVEHCAQPTDESGNDRADDDAKEKATAAMKQFLPTLKHWAKI